jgi:hypothetical protein
MPRVPFSPLEEYVLQLLGEQWHTRLEVKRKLWPAHTPEAVNLAFTYLKRHDLILELPRPHGDSYWEQTPLGAQVLADQRRSRSPLHVEGARVG